MSAVPSPAPARPPGQPWYHWRRLGFNFLTISLAAHLLFGMLATYLIVQTIQAKRQQTFAGRSQSPNASTRAIEHKVQMQKQRQTMSAPAAIRRVTTTSNATVALPAMPLLSKMDSAIMPRAMAGMGGTGLGLGLGVGGGGVGSGGGGGLSLFGLRTGGNGLKGSFYDLKQTHAGQPTAIKAIPEYVHALDAFLHSGWNEASLAQYFKAPNPLYATQIFIPPTASVDAPKAFGVENQVKPSLWMALYKGKVCPPGRGVYHFVGGADNILIVRLDGVIVLDRSWNYQKQFGIDKNWKAVADYDYGFGGIPGGFAKGPAVSLDADEYHDMEVLIGDDGGRTHFTLLVETEGTSYAKTAKGLPILPVFRLAPTAPPPGEHPPFQPDGPVWKARSSF